MKAGIVTVTQWVISLLVLAIISPSASRLIVLEMTVVDYITETISWIQFCAHFGVLLVALIKVTFIMAIVTSINVVTNQFDF